MANSLTAVLSAGQGVVNLPCLEPPPLSTCPRMPPVCTSLLFRCSCVGPRVSLDGRTKTATHPQNPSAGKCLLLPWIPEIKRTFCWCTTDICSCSTRLGLDHLNLLLQRGRERGCSSCSSPPLFRFSLTPPPPPAMSTSRKRPHTLNLAPAHRRHPRYIRPPPRSPYPWVWSCHRCTSFYRFSAALNRCLACSHRFCRKCNSEYDYVGWDQWKTYWAPLPGPESTERDERSGDEDSPMWSGTKNNAEEDQWDVEWLAWSSSYPEPEEEGGESFATTRGGDGRLWFRQDDDHDSSGVLLGETSAPRPILVISTAYSPSEDDEESPVFSPDSGEGRMIFSPRMNVDTISRGSKLLPALDLAISQAGLETGQEMLLDDVPLLEREQGEYGLAESPVGRWQWWRSDGE
ncbi:hypothetical protein FN846DRAFT_324488 [Sphaerosporella brunnea]|uniref:Uncharacterized protein n=1 Tax=Sphaerosporella brunnea TaxID=1250544 RepID=A0A5J5F616_9PEZI|nr:hypothetical protein FN846DRAFT_324488 [Sphaerosporella brunnea]